MQINLSLESMELTADIPKRTITGVAVPLDGKVINHSGHRFTFLPNSVEPDEHTVLLEYHDRARPVGRLTHYDWSETGMNVEFKVSETIAGDEQLRLAKDGVNRLSIGLIVDLDLNEERNGVWQLSKAGCKEISLTPLPALATSITAVSLSEEQEGTTMPDIDLIEVQADVVNLKETTEDINRKLATMNFVAPVTPTYVNKYKTAGQWIKGLANHEDEAFEVMNLAYTGGTTADSSMRPGYVTDAIRLVEQLRVSMNVFSSAPLPPEGMSVDYLKLGTDSTTAAEQAAEGDTLAFSKLSLGHASAPVKTYGSYTTMSIQEVKRSPANIVDLTYQGMVRQVAKVTDLAFITAMIAAADANAHVVRANASGVSTVDQWSDALIDAEVVLAALSLGLPAEFVLCDLTSFKTLSKLRGASAIPFLIPPGATGIGSGVASGTTTPSGLRGEVGGLPLYVDVNLASGNIFVGNSAAMQVLGDPTPVRLQGDPDLSAISTLTESFSVYLFSAVTTPYPGGLVRIATS